MKYVMKYLWVVNALFAALDFALACIPPFNWVRVFAIVCGLLCLGFAFGMWLDERDE